MTKDPRQEPRWLLLIHQLPATPAYLRVKVGRRLQALGAVAIKNSVYVLPYNDETQEDFHWLQKEIEEGGGEATICEARFVDGMTDRQLEEQFNAARNEEYRQLTRDALALMKDAPGAEGMSESQRQSLNTRLRRFKRRFSQIKELDFFEAAEAMAAERAITDLENHLTSPPTEPVEDGRSLSVETFHGRTWVTRKRVGIDRIGSAWLIRRFIDPEAHFKFVEAQGYKPEPEELRFDMFEAEFTHEGDWCTFEVLLDRFNLQEPALQAIAEIVHDLDYKDEKFQRVETAGVAQVVAGVAAKDRDDPQRLEQGGLVFEALYQALKSSAAVS